MHVKLKNLELDIDRDNLEIYNKFVNELAKRGYGTKSISRTSIKIARRIKSMLSGLYKLKNIVFVHTVKSFARINELS